MRRFSICSAFFCALLASTFGLFQHRIKRQSAALEASSGVGAVNVDKSDLEALKVNILKKFLLAVLFSAHNDEKRTNETKVRPLLSPLTKLSKRVVKCGISMGFH